MLKFRLTIAFLLLCGTAPALSAAPLPLSERHKEWLERDVVYIISDREKEVFTQLTSEELRDQFIEMFWKQRDPTPATALNEFKDEHYRRIAYANTWFGSRKKGDGWRSDRGRIYILFGEPKEKVKFTGENDIRDCEIWFMDPEGLLTGVSYFRLLFYQKTFAHDFVLYSPTHDGPQELAMQIAPTRQQALDYLYERAGQALWEAAQSSIPTEPLDGSWSPQSEILLTKIEDLRNHRIDPAWADSFLVTRGRVSTRLSFRNLNMSLTMRTFFDLQKEATLNVAFGIRSEDLKVGEIDGRYYSVFDVRTFIEQTGTGREVIKRSDHWETRFETDGGQILAKPISLQQAFPLVPGKYRILWVFDDLISETFSYRQAEVEIPDPQASTVAITPPLLSSRYQAMDRKAALELYPFRIFNIQYHPELALTFNRGDDLNVFFQYLFPAGSPPPSEVRFEIEVRKTLGTLTEPLKIEHVVPKERLGTQGILFVHRQIPVAKLQNGEHELTVRAFVSGTQIAESEKVFFRYKAEEIQVRPQPDAIFPPFLTASPQYVLERARQFEAMDRKSEAIATVKAAIAGGNQAPELATHLKQLETQK